MIDMMDGIQVEQFTGARAPRKPWQTGSVLTTKSFLLITKLLFDSGFSYVLGGHFTQDCLENVFSFVRRNQKAPTALHMASSLKKYCISKGRFFWKFCNSGHTSLYNSLLSISVAGDKGSYEDDGPDAGISALRSTLDELERLPETENQDNSLNVSFGYDILEWIGGDLQAETLAFTRCRYRVYPFVYYLSFIVAKLYRKTKCRECKDLLQ